MNISFSVVIPSYNRADIIGATIRSFLQQDYPSFELIIVNDGGSDNLEEVVKAFTDPRVKYLYKQNGERGAARNFGAAHANGDYITFFDSDDVVYPYYLSHACKKISQLNNPACYAQAFELVDHTPKVYPPLEETTNIERINKRLLKENILACNGVFLRKDTARSFPFSENRDLSGSEDRFLWLQIAANFPFFYSPVTCSCLINHTGRGELNIDPSKVKKRIDLLISLIKTDRHIAKFTPAERRKILSAASLLGAIKLAGFTRYKLKSIFYLFGSIVIFTPSILTRNFLATFRLMMFSWK